MDIFELSEVDVAFKIQGKQYKLVDPKFSEKVSILKEMEEIGKLEKIEGESAFQHGERMDKAMKTYIKVYLPSIEDEVLSQLSDRGVTALHQKITELAAKEFGAIIKKVEAEKKSEAAPVDAPSA